MRDPYYNRDDETPLERWANRTFAAAITVAALWWTSPDVRYIVDIADGDSHPTTGSWVSLVFSGLLDIALLAVAAWQWRRRSRLGTKLIALGSAVALLGFAALLIARGALLRRHLVLTDCRAHRSLDRPRPPSASRADRSSRALTPRKGDVPGSVQMASPAPTGFGRGTPSAAWSCSS